MIGTSASPWRCQGYRDSSILHASALPGPEPGSAGIAAVPPPGLLPLQHPLAECQREPRPAHGTAIALWAGLALTGLTMDLGLKTKRALVTGGSRSIGMATIHD